MEMDFCVVFCGNTMQCCCIIGLLPSNCALCLCLWQFTCVLYFLDLLLTKSYITFKDVWGETRIIRIEFLDAFWFKIFIYLTSFDSQTAAVFNLLNGCSMTMCIPWNLLPLTVVPIEVFLKYWFNTLPQADQFISSSSSRYSYTSCERSNSKNLIISGRFLSIYDWLVAQTTKVIGAFKLFNRKFTIILGSVWIFRGTWSNELVSPR